MAPSAGGVRLRKLLDAVMALGDEPRLPAALERIVGTAVELTGAAGGAFAALDQSGHELEEVVVVPGGGEGAGAGVLPSGGVLAALVSSPRPLRLAAGEAPTEGEPSDGRPDATTVPAGRSFLGVPIEVRQRVYGFLCLTDKEGAEGFDERDEELAVSLAKAAGMAVDNAAMRERFGEVVVLEERERIARELHDVVIQRIYGVGLHLQACLRDLDAEELRRRLESAVSDLDETIDDIRATIYELQSTRRAGTPLRRAVADLVEESARALGFTPEVHVQGPVDTAVTAATAEHLLIVLREALSNVARHARATSAQVRIRATEDQVELVVSDDGVGPPQRATIAMDVERPVGPGGGQGLRNIAARAEKLGGTASFDPGPAGGSVLRWAVPLHWMY